MRKGSALLATTLTAWMEQPGRAEEFGRRLMAEAAELTEQGDAREMRCAVLKAANSSRKPRSAAELALDAFDAACKG